VPEELDELDKQIGKRFLLVEIHPDGTLQCDPEGISGWELIGIGCWVESLGHAEIEEEEE
jgi:hypothetical protein